MRNIKLLFLIFLGVRGVCAPFPPQPLTNELMLSQEINYSCEKASEVYLVWGINNWMHQDEKIRPEGTYIKGNLMITPMKLENGVFSVQLKVKPNTLIDYVFWITKGELQVSSDTWDLNKAPLKDYHTVTYNNNSVLIRSDINVKPSKPLSLLDFSGRILITLLLLLLSFFIIRKYRYKELSLKPSPRKLIIGSGLILLLALFFIRPSVLRFSWEMYSHPIDFMPQMFFAGFYDFLYVACITIVFLLMVWLCRKFRQLQFAIALFFVAVVLISLVAGILNIRVVEMLGKPFNYRWLYYSDFLQSADAKSALSMNISTEYIINIGLICLAAIIGGILLISVIELFILRYKIRNLLFLLLLCFNVGYCIVAGNGIDKYKWSHDRLANPVTEFIDSVNPFTSHSALFTMNVADSLKFSGNPAKKIFSDHPPGLSGKIKNVIIFVNESTPAEYMQPYGSKYEVTPTLQKYASSSIVFENIYAHAPATNKAVVCLLGSLYPWLSYTGITQEQPDVRIPTLSSELKSHGYQTAFFNSGENSFQRWNEFLAHRKFDNIKDCKELHCANHFDKIDKDWDPNDGIDDECTVDEMTGWIKKNAEKPFFSMLWTYQTHYPYYVSGTEKEYDTHDPVFNRYLNAVHHSDFILGKLLEELKENNLFESTLVVVIGDHGEAFGRHDQVIHASKIYEENLHIPCILINPLLKNGRNPIIGGMADIAPTIMNLLQLPVPEKWQGKNLFTAGKDDRVYFFCPWSDYLFGYREGNMKYIYNATKGTTEIYDLKTDPLEAKNLADAMPKEVEICIQRLAGWVQYQERFMEGTLHPTKKNTSLLIKK